MNKPTLAITMGDAAGIGPEIIIKAFSHADIFDECNPFVIGNSAYMQKVLNTSTSSLTLNTDTNLNNLSFEKGTIPLLDTVQYKDFEKIEFGKVQEDCGSGSYQAVVKAVELQLEGSVHGMVTAPLNKEAMHLAGHFYDGHTELLAVLTNTRDYRMLLSTEKLKIVHVTTHLSMLDACKQITQERVLKSILLADQHLKELGYHVPRIAVCGLNPHAGENGIFGKEELDIIQPAVEEAEKMGVTVSGPFPGDAVFRKAYQGEYDLLVAMYHDQGHIPAKMVAFDSGVNVTIGLPIIRTSVDHGTAFDIAGKGIADERNILYAMEYAVRLAKGKHNFL